MNSTAQKNATNNTIIPTFAIVATTILLASCSKMLPPQTQLHMGTVCAINLYGDGTEELYEAMFQRLDELEHMFSVNLQDSDISRINNAAGIEGVEVPVEVIDVLETACKIAQETGGAFDPTIGPLVRLWDIGGENPRVPSELEIQSALPLVDWTAVKIDRENCTVFLSKPGMALDLGGIVKGYAADQLVKIAARANVSQALFDLGGNVYAYGTKQDGSPWRVGIKNPQNPAAKPIIRLDVENKSVVTSGVYERFFEKGGMRYHHILDTNTGFPMDNGVLSVSIVSENSMLADALSTSAFILGVEAGLELVEKQPAEAIFVMDDGSVHASSGIQSYMTLLF